MDAGQAGGEKTILPKHSGFGSLQCQPALRMTCTFSLGQLRQQAEHRMVMFIFCNIDHNIFALPIFGQKYRLTCRHFAQHLVVIAQVSDWPDIRHDDTSGIQFLAYGMTSFSKRFIDTLKVLIMFFFLQPLLDTERMIHNRIEDIKGDQKRKPCIGKQYYNDRGREEQDNNPHQMSCISTAPIVLGK